MKKTVYVAECRITNREQTIDREKYVEFRTLREAKKFITNGFAEWDGTGKGIGNGQVKEEVRDYNNDLMPDDYDIIRFRVYSPMKDGTWYRYDWVRG